MHGDFKAMNVMLPADGDGGDVGSDIAGGGGADSGGAMLIDFASCGVGYGMCDVRARVSNLLITFDVLPFDELACF